MNASADLTIKFLADMRQMQTSMQRASSEVKAMGQQLTNLAGMVGIAFGVSEIMSFSTEAANLASQAEGITRAFERLNRPDLLAELQAATKGTVDNITLMKSAVKAANFGLPIEQLATYFEFAHRRARETGESVDYLVESIVLGISRKSIPILDNLGFSSERVRTSFEKTGDMAAAIGQIIQEDMANAGDYMETSADKIDQQKVAFQNLKTEIGENLIPTYIKLLGVMNKLALAGKVAVDDQLSFMEKIDRMVIGLLNQLPGGASDTAKQYAKILDNKSKGGASYFPTGVNPDGVNVQNVLFPNGGVSAKAGTGASPLESLTRVQETMANLASKTIPALNTGLQTMGNIQANTLPMFDENLFRIQETFNKLYGAASFFGQALQQSFEAALINGEEFFFVLGEWLGNFLKQMAAAVASALALAAIMTLVAPGAGSFGSLFQGFLGGSGGQSGQLFGILQGSDIFLSNQRTGVNRGRTGG